MHARQTDELVHLDARGRRRRGWDDRRDKAIAALRYRLDAVTEYFPQRRHVDGEDAFLDEGVRPDGLQDLAFGDEPAAVAHQADEDVEGFRRERNVFGLAARLAAPEPSLGCIERER